tara:strand:- start:1431 stop:1709 length:279 start_codon:yes stop_codon:yes gene_type:complete
MARPSTREKRLKDGYYIEVRNNGGERGIKIRRESKEQIDSAMEEYKRTKEVAYLGLVKNGKFIEGPNAVAKKSRAKAKSTARKKKKTTKSKA